MVWENLLEAAVSWWTRKRPVDWSISKHLKQPAVNCRGPEEHALAEAVAEYMQQEKNK